MIAHAGTHLASRPIERTYCRCISRDLTYECFNSHHRFGARVVSFGFTHRESLILFAPVTLCYGTNLALFDFTSRQQLGRRNHESSALSRQCDKKASDNYVQFSKYVHVLTRVYHSHSLDASIFSFFLSSSFHATATPSSTSLCRESNGTDGPLCECYLSKQFVRAIIQPSPTARAYREFSTGHELSLRLE